MLLFTLMSVSLSVILVTPLMAQDYSGDTTGGLTYNRTNSICGSLAAAGGGVKYHSQPIWFDLAESYLFHSDQQKGLPEQWDGYLFLYQDEFDPTNPLTNCIIGDDDAGSGASEFTRTVDTNRQYFIVTTGYSPSEEGAFSNSVTGPGNIYFDTIAPTNYSLTVTTIGQGKVTSNPAAIDCSSNSSCTAYFGEGEFVQLAADTSQYWTDGEFLMAQLSGEIFWLVDRKAIAPWYLCISKRTGSSNNAIYQST